MAEPNGHMGSGSPSGDPLVGTILDSVYRITRVLGAGAMGLVYEAEQIRLGNRVAVKLMARDLAADALALARFRREAEVTGQLGHPHIVRVFDFGTAPSGEPFLVMEFLEGEDLECRLRRVRRLPVSTVLQIVKQTASALAATHARGIVHRDLKPANIFLQEIEGEPDFVKVVDFGVSKARAATMKLTQAATIVGTPYYMAPEQASGKQSESIDHRVDQWALAVIAYELLAGVPPFQADELTALLYRVVHEEPGLQGLRASHVPNEVEAVIRRALSKKPEDRFPTISAFARAFDKAISGGDRESGPTALRPKVVVAEPLARSLTAFRQGARTIGARVVELWQRTKRDSVPRDWRLLIGAGSVALAVLVGVAVITLRSSKGGTEGHPAVQPPPSVSQRQPVPTPVSPTPVVLPRPMGTVTQPTEPLVASPVVATVEPAEVATVTRTAAISVPSAPKRPPDLPAVAPPRANEPALSPRDLTPPSRRAKVEVSPLLPVPTAGAASGPRAPTPPRPLPPAKAHPKRQLFRDL